MGRLDTSLHGDYMTVRTVDLVPYKNAENSATLQYTAGSGVYTIIDKCVTTNYSAGAQTFSIWKVPSGGSVGNSNLIKTKTLAISETYTWPEVVGHYLNPGESIYIQAGAATSVNFNLCGREST